MFIELSNLSSNLSSLSSFLKLHFWVATIAKQCCKIQLLTIEAHASAHGLEGDV